MAHSLPRRGFLKRTLGACWVGAPLLDQAIFRAAQARAQSSPALPTLFDLEKVADGIWAAIARPQALINANAAVFELSNGLLVVDTHSKPSAVVSLVSQIRRELSQKPVRYVVNSHFHWDHSQGNGGYRRLAPQADLVASEPTRRLIADLGTSRAKATLEQARASLEQYRQQGAITRTAADQAVYRDLINQTNAYVRELENYSPELPNLTFDRDLILHDPLHDLHLAWRGRGHTAGDVVVFCPRKKVIATGDLLHGLPPYLVDSYPIEWPRTLLSVAEFDFDRVIGGHGGVQRSKDRLYQKATFIEEIAEEVRKGKSAGRSVGEIKARVTPATLKSLAHGYGQFLLESRARYALITPDQRDGDPLAVAVGTCIEQTASALDNNK